MDVHGFCLEVFHIWQIRVVAEGDRLEIADDVPVALFFEHKDIKETVIQARVFEEHEGPAIQPPVADQDKASFAAAGVRGVKDNGGRGNGSDLRKSQEIADRP